MSQPLEAQFEITNKDIEQAQRYANSQEIVWLDGFLAGRLSVESQKFVEQLIRLVLENKMGKEVKLTTLKV